MIATPPFGDAPDYTPFTVLPELPARWIATLLPNGIPDEPHATCDRCAMCSDDAPAGSASFFHPDAKCCTYEPALPNFIVGRILRDTDPAMQFGRRTVEARMAARLSATPWGLEPTRRHRVLYGDSPELFGRAPDLRCPHYQGDGAEGTCGIWRHRNAVCATWHCKHVRGDVGLQFWRSLSGLLSEAEWALGAWCVTELGGPTAELCRVMDRTTTRLAPADLGGPPNQAEYEAYWGSWTGRESEYFTRAAALVDPLDWAAVERIGGVRIRAHATLVRDAYQALVSTELPQRTTLGTLRVLSAADGKCTVQTYSGYDPLRMPATLISLLPQFDGSDTHETVTRIASASGVQLGDGIIRKLLDFGLLRKA